jgi:hypothetical protein
MNHRYSTAALAASAALALVSQAAMARDGSPLGANMQAETLGIATVANPHKLKTTHTANANGFGSALAAGAFNVIDSRNVNCADICTIGIESMVQINPAGGNWAICLRANGVYLTCQYQGHLPDVSTFVVGNARGVTNASLAAGVYVVQTEVFTANASSLYGWQTDYRIYKP